MSYRALDWAFAQTTLNRNAAAVLKQLAYHHNHETGRCDPGSRQLSAGTGIHRTALLAALDWLERHGYISRAEGARGGYRYTLHLDRHTQPKQYKAAPKARPINPTLPTKTPEDAIAQWAKARKTSGTATGTEMAGRVVQTSVPEQGINRELRTLPPKGSLTVFGGAVENPGYTRPRSTRQRTMAEDLADTSWAT